MNVSVCEFWVHMCSFLWHRNHGMDFLDHRLGTCSAVVNNDKWLCKVAKAKFGYTPSNTAGALLHTESEIEFFFPPSQTFSTHLFAIPSYFLLGHCWSLPRISTFAFLQSLFSILNNFSHMYLWCIHWHFPFHWL